MLYYSSIVVIRFVSNFDFKNHISSKNLWRVIVIVLKSIGLFGKSLYSHTSNYLWRDMIEVGQFKAWNLYILKMFMIVEAIRFNVIVASVNSRIWRKLNPETVRVFLDKLTDDGYLKKGRAERYNESVYTKTEKFDELIKDYGRLNENFLKDGNV